MNKQEVLNKLQRNLYPKTSISSWDEGYNTGVTLAIRTITELDSLEQILVPQYVADWIEWCKRNKVFLLGGFSAIDELGFAICNDKKVKSSKASKWATRNQETFAKAWLFGYEVEKEKLYKVSLKKNGLGIGIQQQDGSFKEKFTKTELSEFGFNDLDMYEIKELED